MEWYQQGHRQVIHGGISKLRASYISYRGVQEKIQATPIFDRTIQLLLTIDQLQIGPQTEVLQACFDRT